MALEREQRHVWYLADIGAVQRNRARQDKGDKVWQAEDLLRVKYRLPQPCMENTEANTDHGARGNWEVLRQNLKGDSDGDLADVEYEL